MSDQDLTVTRNLKLAFMDTRLAKHHEIFHRPAAKYDTTLGHFVAAPASSAGPPSGLSGAEPDDASEMPMTQSLSKVMKSMSYWDLIFPKAMEEMTAKTNVNVSKTRDASFHIRGEKTWVDVYAKLEEAQNRYLDKTPGVRAKLRRVWRWTAENASEPVRAGTRLVPQMDVVTPVVGAVQIVLEAAKRNAEIRKRSLEAFDDLDDLFSDVEVFVGTFRDTNTAITKKAVALVASVLHAVERVIAFFTHSTRMIKILLAYTTSISNIL